MGIKDLKKYLREKNVDCFFTIPLYKFSQKRIAIDSLNWIFTYLSVSIKNIINRKEDIFEELDQEIIYVNLLEEFIKFNIKLLDHHITPIWIWDGKSKDNKNVTKIERRKSRKEQLKKRLELKEKLKDMNALERPIALINQYKNLFSTTCFFSSEKLNKIKDFSIEIGIPTITAKDEAENLASSLAVERKVAAVWSADTDTYPLGAPVVVKGFEKKNNLIYISGIFTLKILKELNMDHNEFRDFCILLGTDFNDRIPSIGPAKSYILIDRYRNIENIEKETRHNTYCLKYKEVRKQLTPYNTYFDKFNKLSIEILENYEQLTHKYKGVKNIDILISSIKNLKESFNVPNIKEKFN